MLYVAVLCCHLESIAKYSFPCSFSMDRKIFLMFFFLVRTASSVMSNMKATLLFEKPAKKAESG